MLDAIRAPALFPTAESSRASAELPLTPAMRSALADARASARGRSSVLELAGGLFLLLTFVASLPIGVAAITIVLAVGALSAWGGWSAGRDLRRATFRRTSGPMIVDDHGPLGARCRLAGRVFWIDEHAGAALAAVSPLAWVTVEYTAHQHFTFEVRDAEDRIVYRAPEYAPSYGPPLSGAA